ncbi:mechanosensitive ion channel protein MscS [Kurthia sp. 3B1D]|uniref:Mechanosensitive ion channel protein MscS n=2 Tax=Kurthia TaxID=1649 RepID=A0A433RW36_9BACL|nr:mechanosensitive ion channel family protein [Kurthia sp. 3B1D]RUS57507.1 mechanosensitive ion channel protein MscS [Kurthia sp. 3B1D]
MLQNAYDTVMNYIIDEKMWITLGVNSLKIISIILGAMIIVRIARAAITKTFTMRVSLTDKLQAGGYKTYNADRRYRTVLRLLKSIVGYVVYFIAGVACLSVVGINITGLIAGAGVVGLAIGFGAQSLVKDVITGFFIIFEDQFGVGDYIRLTNIEGTVLEIGLRTTKIKGAGGEINIVPNGSITEVINYSINNSTAIIDVSVAYSSDINKAEELIIDYLRTLPQKDENIVGEPTLLGVQSVVGAEVVLRISVETLPMQHFGISRMIRRDVKEMFDANGIDIPYPKMMVYEREATPISEEGEE